MAQGNKIHLMRSWQTNIYIVLFVQHSCKESRSHLGEGTMLSMIQNGHDQAIVTVGKTLQ